MARQYDEQEKRDLECSKIKQDNLRGWIALMATLTAIVVSAYGVRYAWIQFEENQQNIFVTELMKGIAARKVHHYTVEGGAGKQSGWTTSGAIETHAAYRAATYLAKQNKRLRPLILATLEERANNSAGEKDEGSILRGFIEELKMIDKTQ